MSFASCSTADALREVARYCRAASGRAGFCSTLLERRDLAAEVFEPLDGVGDLEERDTSRRSEQLMSPCGRAN